MRSYYYFLIIFLFMPVFIFAQTETETLRIETFYGRGGAGISTTEDLELAKDSDDGLVVGDLIGSPMNKLEVKGNAAIGAGYAGNSSAPENGLIVEGNVGIGTPWLDSQLHAQKSFSGLSNLQQVHFGGTDSEVTTDILFNQKGSVGGYADFGLINAKAGGTSVFYVRGNGNVGIGTTEPRGLLEVSSTPYSYRRDIKILDAAFLPRCPCDTSIWTEECGTDFTSSIDLGPVCYDHFMGSYSHKYTREGSYLIVKDDGKVGIGTAEPEGKLDVAGKIYEQGNPLLPKGVIVIWSGDATDIPAGWALCDGNNGTPNLQSRFIVGADSNYKPGATGGKDAVILDSSQIPSHYHLYQTGYNTALTILGTNGNFGGGNPDDTSCVYMSQSAGGGLKHENRPPYYALCYIMKL